jgi:multicomponent Na+:H+ antiporter subunit A
MDASIALVAIAPFVAALLAPLAQRLTKPFAGWVLAAVPLAIFAFLLTLVEPVIANGAVSASIGWVPAYDLNLSFFVDGLSLTFALTISKVTPILGGSSASCWPSWAPCWGWCWPTTCWRCSCSGS